MDKIIHPKVIERIHNLNNDILTHNQLKDKEEVIKSVQRMKWLCNGILIWLECDNPECPTMLEIINRLMQILD